MVRYDAINNNSATFFAGDICCGNGIGIYIDQVGPNIRLAYGDGVLLSGFSTGSWYSVQALFNGATTSGGNVNGTTTSTINGATEGDASGAIVLGADAGNATNCDCTINEAGIWHSALGTTQRSNMVTNQRSGTFGWGF